MKELWIPVSGAVARQRDLETLANNVANLGTPGFKQDQVLFREHLLSHEKSARPPLPRKEWSPQDFFRLNGAEKSFVKADTLQTRHTQGQLVPTKNPFDFAIKGQGFFRILTPGGIRYTRRGTFGLNGERELVNSDGYPVLGPPLEKENPIVLPGEALAVNKKGEIFMDGRLTGQIGLTEFFDLQKLLKQGNMFASEEEQNIDKGEGKSTLHQGFLEQSNVNSMDQMSRLIKAHRNFESLQRVIKAYDQMAGKAFNEITRF